MKQKFFAVMVAIATLFATSCQKEMEFDANVSETSVVSFNLSTPEMVTRAYSDGLSATALQYAVYDANGNELDQLTKTDGTINKSTTVTLQLTNGNEYSIVFWAAAPNAPYEVNFANKKMTVYYTKTVSNSDNLDAFYAYQTFKVDGPTVVDVTLKRPFAQLNIGTSDYEISEKAGYVPTQSEVTVKQVYSVLNFASGEVSGPTDAVFQMKAIDRNETFPVSGNDYLAMAYLLVPADNNLVNIKFTHTNDSKEKLYPVEVENVPVKRNYRTNIYGEILTSNVTLNVEIKPEYEGNVVSVSTWEEFTAALVDGNYIMLTADIEYASNYQLQKSVTLDLGGYSMTLPMINIHTKTTIKNGTINGKVYARKNAEIVFDNVKFSGAVADNLSTEGHLAIQGGCKSLYAKNCLFSPTSVSGSQTKPLSFEGGSTIMKFEGCEFKSSPYKKQVYLNSLSAAGSLEFVNCNFNNKTPNIMFAAACPLTNLKMSGTTKLDSVTLETNRAKEAVTAEDLAYLRESLIANNSMSSVRLFYAGGSSEYIR